MCWKFRKVNSIAQSDTIDPKEEEVERAQASEETDSSQRKRKVVSVLTPKEKYRAVVMANLKSKPLLNEEEKKVFKMVFGFLERWNANLKNPSESRGLILLSQVSLGEFIGPEKNEEDWSYEDKNAWFALQGRRVDFLIIDQNFHPILAIEHQGSGHFQGDWKERDKLKQSVYRYAGIQLVKTTKSHLDQPNQVSGMIAGKLRRKYDVNYQKEVSL